MDIMNMIIHYYIDTVQGGQSAGAIQMESLQTQP